MKKKNIGGFILCDIAWFDVYDFIIKLIEVARARQKELNAENE